MGYYESLYLCLDAEALNILTVTAYHDDVFAGMFFKKLEHTPLCGAPLAVVYCTTATVRSSWMAELDSGEEEME